MNQLIDGPSERAHFSMGPVEGRDELRDGGPADPDGRVFLVSPKQIAGPEGHSRK